jgi:hypothetical protein
MDLSASLLLLHLEMSHRPDQRLLRMLYLIEVASCLRGRPASYSPPPQPPHSLIAGALLSLAGDRWLHHGLNWNPF